MEIILAIVVAAAVIFFGALISMGNERQRKAIDALREQSEMWALQDLKIKRKQLAIDISVDNPISWLNRIAFGVYGYDQNLQILEVFSKPQALVCITSDGANKVIFSPLSPAEIRKLSKEYRNRLSQFTDGNPLFSLPHKTTAHEFSVLTNGYLFDLELAHVWKSLMKQEVDQMDRVWIYVT